MTQMVIKCRKTYFLKWQITSADRCTRLAKDNKILYLINTCTPIYYFPTSQHFLIIFVDDQQYLLHFGNKCLKLGRTLLSRLFESERAKLFSYYPALQREIKMNEWTRDVRGWCNSSNVTTVNRFCYSCFDHHSSTQKPQNQKEFQETRFLPMVVKARWMQCRQDECRWIRVKPCPRHAIWHVTAPRHCLSPLSLSLCIYIYLRAHVRDYTEGNIDTTDMLNDLVSGLCGHRTVTPSGGRLVVLTEPCFTVSPAAQWMRDNKHRAASTRPIAPWFTDSLPNWRQTR